MGREVVVGERRVRRLDEPVSSCLFPDLACKTTGKSWPAILLATDDVALGQSPPAYHFDHWLVRGRD